MLHKHRQARWTAAAILWGLFLLSISGCQQPPVPSEPLPPPITLAQALERYNANIAAIPAFRASIKQWHILFTDPNGKLQDHSDILGKLFFKPAGDPLVCPSFYLQADVLLQSEVLVLGSNAEEFWVYSKAAKQGAWARHDEHPASIDSNSILDTVNPNDFLELIGLRSIPANPSRSPYPTLKVDGEYNIIEYLVVVSDGLKVRRQLIIDRRTDLPLRIFEYDYDGLCIRRTYIKKYIQLEQAFIPAEFQMVSDLGPSSFSLELENFKLDTKDRRQLFTRPSQIAGLESYTQIDPTQL